MNIEGEIKRTGNSWTYTWKCGQCFANGGSVFPSWAEAFALMNKVDLLHKHCRMRVVCMMTRDSVPDGCTPVIDDGTPGAATSHGICPSCAAKMESE